MSAVRIEIVWAERDRQCVVCLVMPEGSTVADALAELAQRREFANIDLEKSSIGVYGQPIIDRSRQLKDGDRIEFYRPLSMDPMTARRLRVSRRAAD